MRERNKLQYVKKLIKERNIIFTNHIAYLGCYSQGLDHNGGDIWRERTISADECGNRCKQISGCKKWTFATYAHDRKCFLKKYSTTGVNPCLECVTGFQNSTADICGVEGM